MAAPDDTHVPTAVQSPSGKIRRTRPPAHGEPPEQAAMRAEMARAGQAGDAAAMAARAGSAPAPHRAPATGGAVWEAVWVVGALAAAGVLVAVDAAWARGVGALVLATAGIAVAALLRARRVRVHVHADAGHAGHGHAVPADAEHELERMSALLQEARHDLERALHVGGPGRYTGQTLGGFRIGVLLGRGAMGEVYEATHTESGAPAAIKLLHAHIRQHEHHRQRFVREAQAAAQLRSDHIVRVLGFGDADGVPYLAMERLDGEDLAHDLRHRRQLVLPEVIELARQIGRGLAAAHAAGIVHRDIKPQNLFRVRDRSTAGDVSESRTRWMILDFGVSKLAGTAGTLTRGHVVGTPGYLAPEQAKGGEVDHRTDLFALAVIAYRALTGLPPFTGKDMPAILHDVVYRMPDRPSSVAPLAPDVDHVLAIGLAKQREDRFESGDALADALADASRSALGERLRAHARELIDRHPWGAALRRSPRAPTRPGRADPPGRSKQSGRDARPGRGGPARKRG